MPNYNFPKIVITGVGAVSPIGNNVEEFWQSMMDGKSGAAPISRFDASDFDTKFACEVKNFDPLLHMNKKEIQRLDLFTQYAISAATMAIEDAGLNFEKINKDRVGVIFGSGIGGMWTYHNQQQELYARGGKPDRISPFFIPMLISDIAPGQIAIRWGLKGPNYGTVSACATSSHSLSDALMNIQRGDADMMLVGGSEAVICPMGVGGFNSMRALSTRNDSPETASRPFDKDRDGFVMGEASGVLVLETLEHALNRGAKIYAEFAGIGLTDDAFHITQPAPGGEGAVRSMSLCIKDAGLTPNDIDYINAHGTSTPHNDRNETQAIKTVFGDRAYKMAISSTKSMTGHLLGAAGAIEAIATVLSIKESMIPPTINYFTQDPECDLDYTPNKSRKLEIHAAISNTFGFGGHNASLCFKAFEE
ncbi:MAG: beta-ketoacyl-[acyl-carrier-protein] synthase II [Ignavibacteria bacterium GWB2_35_12]|nr:MAG: beta-ketoacyl-[acyl-carrier-protein] synthase II [Ignavibacteria bacterium GWA2_35_8]OGU41632.1 MAG: beta-ketoacyl-[acyl-carrier-protein] synthase II [Ignavibacteria bacterium GWB2_35_12]OGV24966.1 MAG: beta-ketoacyl-[acyl-carrier-protein] synthase II [Ignavibacteria bacterium RIFOXYC2_FULL_35_21]